MASINPSPVIYGLNSPVYYGIRVVGLLDPKFKGTTQINLNDIHNTQIGIELKNIPKPIVYNNQVNLNPQNANYNGPPMGNGAPVKNYGFVFKNCPESDIQNNLVDGLLNTAKISTGYLFEVSDKSQPKCNTAKNTGDGIAVFGIHPNVVFKGNLFENNTNGIFLNKAIISTDQPSQANGPEAGFNKWLNNNLDLESVGMSSVNKIKFYVNNSGNYYPSYYNQNNFNPVLLNTWNNTDNCSNLGGGGCVICPRLFNVAIDIIHGNYSIEGFEASSLAMAQLKLYRFLMASDEALNYDTDAIASRDNLLANAEVIQFLNDFENADVAQLEVVNNFINQNSLQAAADANDAVIESDDFILTNKNFNNLYLSFLDNPMRLKDTLFQQALLAIATACPLQYGDAVFKAQSFYLLINPQIHFQNESACDISQSRMQHTINSSKKVENKLSNETLVLKIYPNPSAGEFQINFADNTIKSQVEVYNAMGMKLLSFNHVNNKTTLNLEHLVTGNYILKIISKNSICFKKIAIIK